MTPEPQVQQTTIDFLKSQKDLIDFVMSMSVVSEELQNRIYGELAVIFEKCWDTIEFETICLLAAYMASEFKITRPGKPENELDNCSLHIIVFQINDNEAVEALGIIVDNTSNHAVDTYEFTPELLKSMRLRFATSFH